MTNAIEVKNLKKMYGNFGVDDVSFALPTGYIMGFVGKNGAGKTTTIKAILNMVNRDAGEVLLFGEDNLKKESSVKKRIGVVMDSTFYEENWTLIQVGKAIKPFYRYWDMDRFLQLLKKFQLEPTKKVKELSRGMRMKIMIACSLAHDPDLLILDEPTSGLDAVARDELLTILREFVTNETKSILFSTHISSDLEKIADYITFINNGRIIHSDTKDNLLEKYVMIKGGADSLTDEQIPLIIGYQQSKFGFEGITLKQNLSTLPKALTTEPCNLDDLVVMFNRDDNQ